MITAGLICAGAVAITAGLQLFVRHAVAIDRQEEAAATAAAEPACDHRGAVDVHTTRGELVARLCLRCDWQLQP